MTAEHAHGIDGGGEVAWCNEPCPLNPEQYTCIRGVGHDGKHADGVHQWDPKPDAADAVLDEARRLCCGENPAAHHAASAKHSELMAFAGDLARAVRGA